MPPSDDNVIDSVMLVHVLEQLRRKAAQPGLPL